MQGTDETATEQDIPVDKSEERAVRKYFRRVEEHVFEERQTGPTNARRLKHNPPEVNGCRHQLAVFTDSWRDVDNVEDWLNCPLAILDQRRPIVKRVVVQL